jgi:hypothetical protein
MNGRRLVADRYLFTYAIDGLVACEHTGNLLENQRLDGCANTTPSLTIASERTARMASSQLPSPDELRQLLRYDPETGKLYWRERSPAMFPNAICRPCYARKWNGRHAGKEAFTKVHNHGALVGSVNSKRVYAHRAIWAMAYGRWPDGEIDHINGDPKDNRLENLRDVSHAENMRNLSRPKNNVSGRIGVHYSAGQQRWTAYIHQGNRRRHLGSFKDRSSAVAAREAAEVEMGFHQNHGRAK